MHRLGYGFLVTVRNDITGQTSDKYNDIKKLFKAIQLVFVGIASAQYYIYIYKVKMLLRGIQLLLL